MRGIILAGGSGTRLHPITISVCKQLLPVYNKPMIYYPLSTMISAGIRDILIITTPRDVESFRSLLGTGESIGVRISYKEQANPNGLAEAFILGEDFIGDSEVMLVLGDNLMHGNDFESHLKTAIGLMRIYGACVFAYPVKDPSRYGVVTLDGNKIVDITEKPTDPKSNLAIPGLYFYNNEVVEIAKSVKPSERGELEITDIHKAYLAGGKLAVCELSAGFAWLDMGTFDALLGAACYVQALEERQGIKIGCIYEASKRNGWCNRVVKPQ